MPGGLFATQGTISPEVETYLKNCDFVVANLESAICDGKTKCHVKMSDPKLGNIIYSPDGSLDVLSKLNVKVVSLANNHICDCDLEGLRQTICSLDKINVKHFGAGRDKTEAESPAIFEYKGKKFCFLGYFPPMWEAPYPPSDKEGGLNHFYIDKVIEDVKKYKKECDFVFVMPHWGKEHTRLPYLYDVRYAKRIIKAGATGVIGSHTHIVQPSFMYNKGVIAMSLGNFIFPDRYIVPPRITYYPSEEEKRADIPIVYGFPIVKTLSYKKVDYKNREGVICCISINDKGCRFNMRFTRLDDNHVLRFCPLAIKDKMKLAFISFFIKDKNTVLYRIYNFVSYYVTAITRKVCSIF